MIAVIAACWRGTVTYTAGATVDPAAKESEIALRTRCSTENRSAGPIAAARSRADFSAKEPLRGVLGMNPMRRELMAERYYSFETVLEILQIEEDELLRQVSEGEIRAFRDDDRMRFRTADVEAIRTARRTEPTVQLLPTAAPPAFETVEIRDDDLDLELDSDPEPPPVRPRATPVRRRRPGRAADVLAAAPFLPLLYAAALVLALPSGVETAVTRPATSLAGAVAPPTFAGDPAVNPTAVADGVLGGEEREWYRRWREVTR